MQRRTKVRAFTLLEALLSLLVISGSLLLFQAMSQLLTSELQYQKTSEVKEWLLFADQLSAELEGVEFVKVEKNRLYVKQSGKLVAFGKSSADDFRKTDATGRGYQPMLYQIRQAEIVQDRACIRIHLQLEKGLERDFIYRVDEKS